MLKDKLFFVLIPQSIFFCLNWTKIFLLFSCKNNILFKNLHVNT